MLRAHTFRARRTSLLARYAHVYELVRNFLTPEHNIKL